VTVKRLNDPRGLILDAIRTSMRTRNYPPTLREIAIAVGLDSTSSVAHHLKAMEAAGLITRAPGHARAIVIADIHPTESETAPVAPGAASDPLERNHQ
jgi:repressor LexA